jgi:hypothetical protein
MENLNTNQTVDYSQTRVIELMRGMTPEDQRTLARFVDAMAHEGLSSTYATLTPTARKMELIDVLARMKSHSITLSQFFCRLSTKRDAMAAMEREIANFQELIALVRLDVASEIDAMLKEVQP